MNDPRDYGSEGEACSDCEVEPCDYCGKPVEYCGGCCD